MLAFTNNKSVKKQKIAAWRIVMLIMVCVIALCVLASGIFMIVCVTDKDYVKFDAAKMNENRKRAVFLDADGQPMETAGGRRGKYVSVSELHDYTLNAFVSTEDKRFYKHHGLDIKRIGAAAIKNIFSGSYKEGASTITQQLVKNTFLTNKKTLKRKVNEMFLTLKVEQEYDKKEILEMYLNTIYFGTNAYGIETASKTYFGKSASELTLAESAGLAGMLKAPNNYSPINNYAKFLSRRNLVLDLMRTNGFIDDNQCESAKEEKIDLTLIDTRAATEKNYLGAAVNETCKLLNIKEEQLINKPYKIKTFFDFRLQNALEKSMKTEIETSGGESASRCAYVVNNISGGVSSYIGYSKYNIYNINRQVGSAIKPLAVYCPALDLKTITPATPVLDEKTDFDGYSPNNFNNKYYGWTTVRRAVADSMNTAAVKVLNSIGVNASIGYLNKNGIKTDIHDKNLSIALGSFYNGVNLKELLTGYLTLANSGVYKSVGFVDEVSLNGKILYKKNTENGARVFRDESAYLMTDMLKTVTQTGTAKVLSDLNFEVAGKTGTAGGRNGNTDAFFCGYDTKNTYMFWVGAESSDPLGADVTGNVSARLAREFLSHAYDESPENFKRPQNIVEKRLDKKTFIQKHALALAHSENNQSEVFTEVFEMSNSPTVVSEAEEKIIPPEIRLCTEDDVPVIFADNLSKNQRLYREFEGKEICLKIEEVDGVIYAVDKKAVSNGIYTYYVKENGKIVSNIEFYYKKVRSAERNDRKWYENWFW